MSSTEVCLLDTPRKLYFNLATSGSDSVDAIHHFSKAGLYCQTKTGPKDWDSSKDSVSDHIDTERTRGIVERDAVCYRSRIIGRFKNEDIVVS